MTQFHNLYCNQCMDFIFKFPHVKECMGKKNNTCNQFTICKSCQTKNSLFNKYQTFRQRSVDIKRSNTI